MTNNEPLDDNLALEADIHAMLNGQLASDRQQRLWERLAGDQEARALLEEMLWLQTAGREAFGLTGPTASTPSTHAADGAGPHNGRRGATLRLATHIAAAAVMAASAAVVVLMAGNGLFGPAQGPPAAAPNAVRFEALTPGDREVLTRLWSSVASEDSRLLPWILLVDGTSGELGYTPAGMGGPGRPRLLLVRCMVLDDSGHTVKSARILLAARGPMRLTVPDSLELADRPVRCEVALEGRQASVGLSAGDELAPVGVWGRTTVGDEPREIGRFRLNERDLRVWVQVTKFQTNGQRS